MPIFEEIHSLNKGQDRNGKSGVVNYFFFTLLELIGGILLENDSFKNLNMMLSRKRLNFRNDGMEDILDWNIQAQFVKVKNDEEIEITGQNWISPEMHYILQLIESQTIPFEFNVKERIVNVDLLFFVFTVIYPRGQYSYYWYPRSTIYLEYGSSNILKKIKLDSQFADKIANELFGMNKENLIKKLGEAKNIFESQNYSNLLRVQNPFRDF